MTTYPWRVQRNKTIPRLQWYWRTGGKSAHTPLLIAGGLVMFMTAVLAVANVL